MLDPRLCYQWKHAIAPVLNVGCESDPGHFGFSRKNVNLDRDLWRGYRRFVCGDAEALPFKARSFATVMLGDVVDHCLHPAAVIREALRVASRRVVITVPENDVHDIEQEDATHHAAFLRTLGQVRSFAKDSTLAYTHKTHGVWTRARLVALLDEIGAFTTVEATGSQHPPGWGAVIETD